MTRRRSTRAGDRRGPAAVAGDDRGQLVLVAAGVVAVALVGLVAAYLQLGYHADVGAGAEPDPAENAERALSRAVHEASLEASGPWSERRRVAGDVRAALAPRIETVETARVAEGTADAVASHRTAAREFARDRCPGGPGRRFGDCRAIRGVVLQDRAGDAEVLAVAVDLTVTTDRETARLTLVIRAVGGPAG